jgi:hypothetical protein
MAEIALEFRLGNDISSRLISWWGQGYRGFSHVDMRLANGWLAGARSDRIKQKDGTRLKAGFQIRPPNYEEAKVTSVVTLQVQQPVYDQWEAWIRAQVDDPYDKVGIIGLFIGHSLTEGDGYWICSAAAYESLISLKIMPDIGIDMRQVAPNTLRVACLAAGFQRELPPVVKESP